MSNYAEKCGMDSSGMVFEERLRNDLRQISDGTELSKENMR